ncbi:MAG: cytochrome b/b6 domain-containing protein [Pseudomonadota bacterium]
MSHPTTYAFVTKVFHWLTALLIIAAIPLGIIANEAPYETGEQLAYKAVLFSAHKTIGIVAFFVAILRILWALTQTKPGPLHPERSAETMLAEVVHWLLYISLVIVPLSGWLHHAATSGFAPIWWPLGQTLPFVPQSEGFSAFFAGLHWIFTKVLALSIFLHIAGALKHHLVDKDDTLRRMWFSSKDMPTVGPHIAKSGPPIVAAGIFAVAAGAAVAMGLTSPHGETVQAAALEEVTSDWVVQEGEIAITINQFGSQVTGSFADWTSTISFDPTPAEVMGSVDTVIAIGSLTLGSVTGEAMGPDYFDAEGFPTATFAADIKPDGDTFVADGTLTIKDQTVPVALPFTLDITDDVAVMAGTVTLDRLAFGVGATSQPTEASLGFAVDVAIGVTAAKAKD